MAGQWFSLDSSTNKTDSHDITQILLKIAINTITYKALTMKKWPYKRCCPWCEGPYKKGDYCNAYHVSIIYCQATRSVYKIILDRRPTSSRNCRGPVNSRGRRTAVSSPVLIIFYFNSGSQYQNFYTWFPATSQYDFRSMSLTFYFLKFFSYMIF